MVFIVVTVAMMCEDPENHRLIRKGTKNYMITTFNKREEDEKDDNKRTFPSVSVWVWHEEPGNCTHLILFPEIIL